MDLNNVIKTYGPFLAILIVTIALAILGYMLYRRRQELLKKRAVRRRRPSSKFHHEHAMPVSISKAQAEQREAFPGKSPAQKLSRMTTCPECKMRVFPKADGTCPSCQAIIKK
jgi:hypothetical protein